MRTCSDQRVQWRIGQSNGDVGVAFGEADKLVAHLNMQFDIGVRRASTSRSTNTIIAINAPALSPVNAIGSREPANAP